MLVQRVGWWFGSGGRRQAGENWFQNFFAENTELWQTFEGKPDAWRAGNGHFPVNGKNDYDQAVPRMSQLTD